ncbi:Yip1 member 6 [Perkinsus olseni]|uniref:Yip1 member 6 n=1 Tax=Perkinsus olseni TaxID=32597 RepID=A0A7J6LWG6_PEROL|nr:Yip1 member 6 [Perkinsus olseni]
MNGSEATSPLLNVSMADLSAHIETSKALAGKAWNDYVAPSHQRLLQTAGYPSPVPEIITVLVLLVTFVITKKLFWRSPAKAREGDCLLRYVQSRKAQQLEEPTAQGQQTAGSFDTEKVKSIMEQVNYLVQMASHQNSVLQSLISETQNQFNSLDSGVSQLKAERDEADYELLTSSQQMIEHLAVKKLPQLDEETRATLPPLDDTPIEGDIANSTRKSVGGSSPFIKLPEVPTPAAAADVSSSENDGGVADVSSSEITTDVRGRAGSSAAATVGSTAVMSDLAPFAPTKEEPRTNPFNSVTAPQNSPPAPAAPEEAPRVPLGYSTDSGMASSNEASDSQGQRIAYNAANPRVAGKTEEPAASPVPAPSVAPSPVPAPSVAPSQVHSAYSYNRTAGSSEIHSAVSSPQASPVEAQQAVKPAATVAAPPPAVRSTGAPAVASPRPGKGGGHAAFGHPTRPRRALPSHMHKRAKPKQILGTTDPFATPMHHGGVSSPSAASSTAAAAATTTGASLTTGARAHTYLPGFPTHQFVDTTSMSRDLEGGSPTGMMERTADTPDSTLDEPIRVTIMRDVTAVAQKLKYVMLPRARVEGGAGLRNWDLWGPLILCMALSVILALQAPDTQKGYVFSMIFVIVWLGSAVVTVNGVLIKGKISFFQSVCVLGYCVFPLVISAIVCFFVKNYRIVKLLVVLAGFVWSTGASVGFMSELVPADRRALGVFPVWLFYATIAWIILLI